MQRNDEWDYMPPHRVSPLAEAGMSALRLALLFGSGAIALALVVTPMVDRSTRGPVTNTAFADGLDMTATGSIRKGGERYTIRRSVLQSSMDAVCVIHQDGSTDGDC